MKKVILSITFALTYSIVNAQVGIGTDNPKATLDVKASTPKGNSTNVDGIIIPRVDRERAQSMVGVEKSTMIFVNDVVSGAQTGTAININSEGFYYFDGLVWIKLPDAPQTLKETYWKAQAPSISPKGENTTANKSTAVDLVEVDIYQKGKVGIGYDSGNSIDFETNPAQKQLEVGGDFRAFYTHKDTSGITNRFLGIETNSSLMPDGWGENGNIIYSSKYKDISKLMKFDEEFEGNAFLQDNYSLGLTTRKGANATFEMNALNIGGSGFQLEYAKGYNGISDPLNVFREYVLLNLNTDVFSLTKNFKGDNGIGYNFTFDKFYIGGYGLNHYTFPTSRPLIDPSKTISNGSQTVVDNSLENTKNDQILIYKKDKFGLEWTDFSSSPKFFYMPSVVLPTVATDNRILDTNNPSYNYDSATSTYSVKIYDLFNAQFNTPVAASSTTSKLTEFVLTADKYDYFVTFADSAVFTDIKVNALGELTYKVNTSAIIRTGSFMNIVLKVK